MRLKTIISGLAAGCLLATGSLLWAQNTNPTLMTPTNLPPRIHAPGGPGSPAARQGLQAILSDEQWASFQKVRAAQGEKLMELRPKIQSAQREVFEAGLAPKYDEAVVQQKAQAAAQLYADMLVTQAKTFSEIQPPLSAEQIEKIKEMQSPPAANPRVLHAPTPPQGAVPNHDTNGLPPKP